MTTVEHRRERVCGAGGGGRGAAAGRTRRARRATAAAEPPAFRRLDAARLVPAAFASTRCCALALLVAFVVASIPDAVAHRAVAQHAVSLRPPYAIGFFLCLLIFVLDVPNRRR